MLPKRRKFVKPNVLRNQKKKMTAENLLTKGYFPAEITPNFSTKNLGSHTSTLIAMIDQFDPVDYLDTTVTPNRYQLVRNKVRSKYSDFSIPKIGQFRRRTGIPNPLHQIRLSNTIASNWLEITKHTEKSQFSLFRLVVDNSQDGRSLQYPKFEDVTKEKILRSVDSNRPPEIRCCKVLQLYLHPQYSMGITHKASCKRTSAEATFWKCY